jgi:Flp pilus assembly pilin Flp
MTKKMGRLLRDQSGAALVIAILLLVVLTLIGLASTFSSILETKLAGNKRGSTEAFYAADGGVQAVLNDISNFNSSTNFVAVSTDSLPSNLQNEGIDSKFPSPSLSLPSGVSFEDAPLVTVYHSVNAAAPRGLGFSAIGNIEFEHFVIDSIGKDQRDSSLSSSTCQIRERVVRLVPTSQGGN